MAVIDKTGTPLPFGQLVIFGAKRLGWLNKPSTEPSRLETLRELLKNRKLTESESRELGGLASAECAKTLE